jgi:outer membrane protein TolC
MKSKKQSEISFNLLQELKNQLQILEKLVDNAIYKQTDLMLLQIEYDNYEVEFKTYLAEQKNNIYDLNLICGINDSNNVNLQDIEFQLKASPTEHSKFLTSYRNDSLNIIAEQIISEQKYKPQLYFFTNAGLNAAYLPTVNRYGFSVGLNFSYNLYDGNQRQIQKEISAINLQNIAFEKKNFAIQNEINKNKYLNQINSIDERIQMIEMQLAKYDKLHNIYELELSQGDISVMDFKNLMKDIAGKKQESLLLKMEKLTLINSYNYWNF